YKPCLVISDIMMPKLNGIELCKAIKSDDEIKSIPIILLTSLAEPEDILRGLESGADNFIIKPYEEESLLMRVSSLLNKIESNKNDNNLQSSVDVSFNDKVYKINSDRGQILDLLMSTFQNALEQNRELIQNQMEMTMLNEQLEERVEQRTSNLIDEIYERKKAEEELIKYQNTLEQMVGERTSELSKANHSLIEEIRERTKIEQEQKLLASVIETSPDYIIIANQSKKVIYRNETAKRLKKALGILPENYMLTSLNSPESADLILEEAIPYAIKNGHWQGETTMIDENKEEIFCSQTITVHRNAEDEIEFFSTTIRDITKIKQIEKDLARKTEDFQRVNEELKQFAYIASHDLQEPLRMISSYTRLLAKRYKDKLDENANDYINFAVDGAIRMQKLIDALLYYSRIGNLIKKFRPVNLNESVENAKLNLHLLIEETKANIVYENLPTVMADSTQMTQLLQNLISNSLKYKPEGLIPEIKISAKSNKKFWTISITDNGIGIEELDYERIFQVFQRLHAKNEYSGTGMGLAICKRIVEYHDGRIWVDSKFGKGSTFSFTIPKESNQSTDNPQ
ncbi:response regulator, partial [bacterium]